MNGKDEAESHDVYTDDAKGLRTLINDLLQYPWQRECTITKDNEGKIIITYPTGNEDEPCLRYSKGPGQVFFWDIYGDDFLRWSLAIIAISKAPAPPRTERELGIIKFSIPLGKVKEEKPDEAEKERD